MRSTISPLLTQRGGNATSTDVESYIERRNLLLKDVDRAIIRQAWFTLSHLLLDDGSKVVDMGCNDGSMTYAMAAMNPKIRFIGLDKSKRQINKAREKYHLHNLEFQIGDVSTEIFGPESLDAIINSYILHEVYSGSRYNERIVSETLRKHFSMLKKGGMMFLRDYVRPPPGQFVLMEMPDKPSKGQDIKNLSDPDLLLWYAQHARPRQDPGCGGFFMEELPARHPNTRLFRLPYKWAYEFIMRLDDRVHWENELPIEYTFFTEREFLKELRGFGARVQYYGPDADEDLIQQKFGDRFRLYDDSGHPIGPPANGFIALSVKMAERRSLNFEERRPSTRAEDSKLMLTAMRDEKTGKIYDVVSLGQETAEILPYFLDEENRLKIYLHDGLARAVANAVPRAGTHLDGRRWSGHMVEPLSLPLEYIGTPQEQTPRNAQKIARDFLGLKPRGMVSFEVGPDYYPEPTYIEERIHTYFLPVEPAHGPVHPRSDAGQSKFLARGVLRMMDAQHILNAISVGLIPNGRLELQILYLFNKLKLVVENWTSKQVMFEVSTVHQDKSLRTMLDNWGDGIGRFKKVKGLTGGLRPVHSVFVEEGHSRGAITGLSAQEMDFVVHSGRTVNTAVVLPLTLGLKQDVHAGFLLEHTPVPQRYEGKSLTIMAPSFNLPREITSLQDAKKFVAEQYGVLPELIIKMGESYYSHIGITPQRIYPFAVVLPADFKKPPGTAFLPFKYMARLRKAGGFLKDTHFMVLIGRAYRYLHESLKLDMQYQSRLIASQHFGKSKPEWSLPLTYARAPSLPPVDEAPAKDTQTSAPSADIIKLTPPIKAASASIPSPPVDFEDEMDAFFNALENAPYQPKPQKW
ncbi:MAG: methyltransferase domain-containing protein [Alphaproteobacteria bacterium]|nr:methyltransferase domain-containing protein [Alphaproteobacteria bacterium]